MFDWLRVIGSALRHFILTVPIFLAAPAMLVIGCLDSSLLSLPEINDYLVVMRCHSHHGAVLVFPLFAAAGSVLGCFLLYTLVRRGGQAVLRGRFRIESIARVERAYARFGLMALIVPALLPPPMPFKVFVATAGALEYPRWRFLVTIMIARSLRYYIEGILAVFYGTRVLTFLAHNGLFVLSISGGISFLVLAIYLLRTRQRLGFSSAIQVLDSQGPKADEALGGDLPM